VIVQFGRHARPHPDDRQSRDLTPLLAGGEFVVSPHVHSLKERRIGSMHARITATTPDGLEQFHTRRGMGKLLGILAAFGAIGTGIGGDGAAGRKKKKKKRVKSGVQGPVGPAGPPGPTGPAGALVQFRSTVGERSPVLGANAGSLAESIAECGEGSVAINCGWTFPDGAAALDRTIVQAVPGSFRGSRRCVVTVRRTATVSAAGGQVVATALCTA
jgi:hypothetical protein